MARKRGPKTSFYKRHRYLKGRNLKRLKPNQVSNLQEAFMFAKKIGYLLNGFLTIKFENSVDAREAFRKGSTRLRRWFTKWGGELYWIYVWEAKGGLHIHALLFVPRSCWNEIGQVVTKAFRDADMLLKPREHWHLPYILKGTDYITFQQIGRGTNVRCKVQGIVRWKRCGTTENLGAKARAKRAMTSSSAGKLLCRNLNKEAG